MDPKVKLAAAGAVAVAAVGAAGYLGFRSLGGTRTIRTASQASPPRVSAENNDPDGSPEGVERRAESSQDSGRALEQIRSRSALYGADHEFPPKKEALAAFDTGAADLTIASETDDSLGSLGTTTRRSLIETWTAFMRPLVAGDQEGFGRAIVDLGGAAGTGNTPADALFGKLSPYLAKSRLDLSAARIMDRDGSDPHEVPASMPFKAPGMDRAAIGIPIMVGVTQSEDADGNVITMREMNIPLGAVFPDAAALASGGAKTVEVWAPAKLADAGGKKTDIGPSVFFVLDAERNTWQPVAMQIALVSDKAASKLGGMMKGAGDRLKKARRGP